MLVTINSIDFTWIERSICDRVDIVRIENGDTLSKIQEEESMQNSLNKHSWKKISISNEIYLRF